VVNPAALIQTGPPSDRPGPPPGRRETDESRCPACDRSVDPEWRVCPLCGTSLHEFRRLAADDSLERDVRRDSTGGHIFASVLGGIVLVGIILFFVFGGGELVSGSPEGPVIVLIGGTALVGLAVGLCVLGYKSKNPTTRTVSGVLGGLAIGAGGVALVVLLMCFAIMASITNFLTSCKCK
jgi:hypothetical protein